MPSLFLTCYKYSIVSFLFKKKCQVPGIYKLKFPTAEPYLLCITMELPNLLALPEKARILIYLLEINEEYIILGEISGE